MSIVVAFNIYRKWCSCLQERPVRSLFYDTTLKESCIKAKRMSTDRNVCENRLETLVML